MKHPSLKNIALIAIAALIIAGGFFFAEYRNSKSKLALYTAEPAYTANAVADSKINASGLTDWKKVLLETSPNGSGADSRGKSGTASAIKSIVPPEPLTPTDKLARDFFAGYMQLRQAGLDTDPQSQQDLVGQVIANGTVLQTPKTYALKDIQVKTDASTASVKQYGNDAGKIFEEYATNSRNETVIVKDYSDKNDSNILKEIDPIIGSYKNILGALLKVSVPETMSSIHLSLINGMSYLLFVAQSLRKSDVDPMSEVQGIAGYQPATSALNQAFNALKNYMNSLGIAYQTSEGGAFFIPTN